MASRSRYQASPIVVLFILFVQPAQGGVRAQMEIQGDGTNNAIRLIHPFTQFNPDAEDLTFTHTANAGNIASNYTVIDNPAFDHGLPHRIFVTQRFVGAFNDEEVAANWMSSFVIGNADGTAMPPGAGFNVFVAPIFEDGFEIGSLALWSMQFPR